MRRCDSGGSSLSCRNGSPTRRTRRRLYRASGRIPCGRAGEIEQIRAQPGLHRQPRRADAIVPLVRNFDVGAAVEADGRVCVIRDRTGLAECGRSMVGAVVLSARPIKSRGRLRFAQSPISDRLERKHVVGVRRVAGRGWPRPTAGRKCCSTRQADAGQAGAASSPFQPLSSIEIGRDHQSLLLVVEG